MRALILSDIHGAELKIDEINRVIKPDIVILPGDIPSSIDFPTLLISLMKRGRRSSYIRNFYQRFIQRANLRQIRTTKLILSKLATLEVPTVFIHGNTETPQTRSWMKLFAIRNPNLFYISDGYKRIGEFLFVGHGWVPHNKSHNRDPSPGEISPSLAQTILLDTYGRAKQNNLRNILISHAPPYGTKLDYLPHRNYFAGSQAVRKMLDSGYFEGVISGHLHETPGSIKTSSWWAINVGASVEDRAAVIDLDNRKIQWISKIIQRPGLETVIYQQRRKISYDK